MGINSAVNGCGLQAVHVPRYVNSGQNVRQ